MRPRLLLSTGLTTRPVTGFTTKLMGLALACMGVICTPSEGAHSIQDGAPLPDRLPVSGRIVSSSGTGIRGASVWFYRSENRPSEEEGEPKQRSPFREPHPVDPSARLVFQQAAITDDDGQFSAVLTRSRSPGVRPEWFVNVTSRGWVSPGVRGVGVEPLLIEMIRPRRVIGQVVLSDDLDPRYVTVEMATRRVACDAAGGFEIRDVPPGVHDLKIFLGLDSEPALVVPDVPVDRMVETGGGAEEEAEAMEQGLDRVFDARLMELDLTSVARFVRLKTLQSDGSVQNGFLVGPLQVAENLVSSGMASTLYGSQTSTFTLPTSQDGLDLAICCYPSRIVRLLDVIGEVRVVLPPPLEIEVSVAGGVSLPPSPWILVPRIESSDAERDATMIRSSLNRYLEVGVVDERRRARLQLPEPGTYRVAWSLTEGGEDSGSGFFGSSLRSDVISEWYPIEVGDTWVEQVFPVPLTSDELEAGLAERQ